jgi:hypothetical protein
VWVLPVVTGYETPVIKDRSPRQTTGYRTGTHTKFILCMNHNKLALHLGCD